MLVQPAQRQLERRPRLLDEVEAAVGRQDICGVYAGLARFELATASTDRLISQLSRIRTIMEEASSFVSPALAADWAAVTEGMTGLLTSLEKDLASAQASGNAKKVADAQAALDARRQWLDQARSGLAEFGGR